MRLGEYELKAILNSIIDALVIVEHNGRIVFLNTVAKKLVSMEEGIIGKHIHEIIPAIELWGTTVAQGDYNQVKQLSETVIIKDRVLLKDKSGQVIGAVIILQDISEVKSLKQQIDDLLDVKMLLNAIIESSQDAISVVDENGLGILVNSAYTNITGFAEAEVINKLADVDIAEGQSVHLDVLKTRQPIKGVPMKVGRKRKEVLVNGSPIIVQGKLRGSVSVIHDVSEMQKLTEELEQAKRRIRHLESKYTFNDIIGKSEAILSAVEKAKRAAQTPATILLRGESGTGKELFAHAIHHASSRANRPFIRVNCAALSESILESELFGYCEGAFTGAKKGGKTGLFEEANFGTLFLDEIGDISLGLQVRLLRVLQEKEIVRVGDTKPIPVEVRVIAATNANLEVKVKEGRFREDLYYRLNVFPVFLPALRERKEDIEIIAQYIIQKLNQEYGCKVERMSRAALLTLENYAWPGNVRELENVIGRALINMQKSEATIEYHHLSQLAGIEEKNYVLPRDSLAPYLGKPFNDAHRLWVREFLTKTLELAGDNKTAAAKILNVSIRNLYYKMEKHGLET